MGKSWAERHPIITGALVGSIVPGIGTIAGALGGVIYDMVERSNDDEPKHKQSTTGDPVLNKTTGEPVAKK